MAMFFALTSRFYLFFIFFCLTLSSIRAEDSKILQAEDVKQVMREIMKQHVEQKNLSGAIVKNSFKVYIEQFDPERIYLLESEVAPYLNPSNTEINAVLKEWEKNEFKSYESLNALIQRSIERAQKGRKSFEANIGRLVEEKAGGRLSDEGSANGFAANITELQNRQKEHFLSFIGRQREKFGKGPVTKHQAQLVKNYEEEMQNRENEYVMLQNVASNTQLQKRSLFYMHVLKALTKSLDAHTSYLNDQEAFDMKVRLEKSLEGIGIIVRRGDDGYVITKVLEGSPAQESGRVHVNDLLEKIDGKTIENESVQEVMNALRGKAGTDVLLAIKRGATPSENVKLTRKMFIVNEGRVTYRYVPFSGGYIGVIKLSSFYQNDKGVSAERDVKRAIEELATKGPLKGLVIDLRENSGGFLSQAVKVAGLFITNGVVVISKYSNGEKKLYRDMDGKISYDGPLVILTSKITASAAEIVAQALQDYGVALVVGDEQTYGKGTIQSQTVTEGDSGSSYFKVTVGKYYTVSGKTPQEMGVRADIVVPSILDGEQIGEGYLDSHLSNDRIDPVYQDSLQDVDPSLKPWYLRYYVPTLQKKTGLWKDAVSQLKESSASRLRRGGYQEKIHTENNGQSFVGDTQLLETVNIVKDMVIYESKNHSRALTTQAEEHK